MAEILRGGIYRADLSHVAGKKKGGSCAALVLSRNAFHERSGTVIAVVVTSQPQRAGFPLTLPLSDSELPKKSWVKISQVRTLSTKRIGEKIASVSPDELASVIEGLNEIICGW